MLGLMTRNWWAVALRGVVAVAFGIMAILWPGLTLATLILLFGAYMLVDGLFAVVAGVASVGKDRWWLQLLEGLAGIVIGVLTLIWPGLTALSLLYFVAAWALVTGVMEIVAAVQMRKLIDNEWMMILSGVLSVLFGAIVMLFPGDGALALTWLIGVYAVIFGGALLVLAFRLRGLKDGRETGTRFTPSEHGI